MRPTFMGFETATRGLMANQKSLDIVGHNTSNIGVTGYTRQRVDLVALNTNMRYTRYQQNTASFAGQGVGVYGVSQVRDKFLDKRFREEYSDVGYYGVTSAVLGDLAEAIDEIAPAKLSTVMTRFEEAWNTLLGESADEKTGAANLLAVANQIVSVFQQMSTKVDSVWNQQEYNLQLDVENINSILGRIAELNGEIARTQFNSMDPGNGLYQPLELLDQRNVLLDQLSEYADIYYETEENGMVTVWMGAKDPENPPAVQGEESQRLMVQTNDYDPAFKTVSVFWNNTGKDVNFATGAIRGTMDMLNGRGLGMDGARGETYVQGIHYFKDKINELAKVFVNKFNNVIEEVRPETQAPYDPPRFKPLFRFDVDGYETAAGIRVSDEWVNNSGYLITNVRDKLDNGDEDNNYAAKAVQLFKDVHDYGEFRGTFMEYINFYSVTKLDNDKSYSDTRLEATSAVSDNLLDQIQQVSGVSMEEEGVDMMMYQKAYDAVSRVFTTLDEMLDKLINGTGAVGR